MRRCVAWALSAAAVWLAGCASHPPAACEAVYDWRTLAGVPGGLGNVDGQGESARFCQPCGVAFDAAGTLYVSDYYNYAVRRVARDGRVTTLAGNVGEPGGSDGTGSAARFDRPLGLALDPAGNVYVADSGNHTVRKIAADGAVTTLAGRAGEPGSADGAARDARFRSPCDVAVDGAGNVYVADSYNHVIRKISAAGAVTTLAGLVEMKGGAPAGGFANGAGRAARFRCPRGLAVDAAGNLLVADTDNAVIRKVTPAGLVTTLAGSAGNAGYANGTGTVARFSAPQGLAVDAQGNVFVADTGNQAVRRVTSAGAVTNVPLGDVRFTSLRDVAVDRAGTLAVVDNESQTVALITPDRRVSVLAGCPGGQGSADGTNATARFNRPCGVVADPQGRLWVTDNFNHTVRRVTPDGGVTTWAGRAGATGAADGTNAAARFFWPSGADRDGAGNLYVADAGNHTLRKVAPDGTVTTLAGSAGSSGSADGTGGNARFSWPADVALDAAGNAYVADRANHTIRKVTPSGAVTTVAGSAGRPGRADGPAGASRFNSPTGVAVDPVGNLYVADTGNHTLRRIVPGGEVTTLAGCAGIKGFADGAGVLARFNGPADLAVDAAGNLIVMDRDNHLVRRVTPGGEVTTLGGRPNVMSAAEGLGAAALFAQPSGVATGPDGTLYVADACNNRVVAGQPRVLRQSVSACGAPAKPAPPSRPASVPVVPYVWEVFAGEPGVSGSVDGQGREARLAGPQSLAAAADGSVYVACGGDGAVRRLSPSGAVTTLAGAGARLRAPVGIGVDRSGTCYVSDSAHVLWKADPSTGALDPLAGCAGQRGSADGRGEAARFHFVPGVAVGADGSVYVADCNNRTIRKVSPQGEVTTLAGRAGSVGCFDGAGAAARFMEPTALAADRHGTLYVADGERIRVVTPQGGVTTLAVDGVRFGRLDGLAVDRAGNLFVADRARHLLWRITPGGEAARVGGCEWAMGGAGWLVTGLAVDRAGNLYVADSVRNCILRAKPQR